jgi:GH15 family glucan-1,4-alpha-glucosidase
MPVLAEEDRGRVLLAEHELLRGVVGLHGTVALEVLYEPRPGFAREPVRLRRRGELGIYCETRGGTLILRSDVPLHIVDGTSASGTVVVGAGEGCWLSLGFSTEAPAVIPALGAAAARRLERSAGWWRAWAARCAYTGPYRDAVVRSALTLKMLTYAPSGAIVAAPTTSLPEEIGGAANWDYRYCWLRDASFTLHALYGLGYTEEAEAFLSWMLHATRLTWPELEVLYDVYGRNRTPERVLAHLDGYRGSRPVRTGNAAQQQLQLDVYGEVVHAALLHARRGGTLDRDAATLLRGIGDTVARRWREPDHGIWEDRGQPLHYTHSKVLCWLALDGLIELHDRYGITVPSEIYAYERGAVRAEIETRGYNQRLDSYTRVIGGDDVDVALLTLPFYGYIDASHSRMRATMVAIHRQLGSGVLLRRNLGDGGPDEGAFGIACFWMAECQAKAGDVDGAAERFERLLGCANDVGLFAEEIDRRAGALLGNFPQGFTHIGLINAALALEAARAPKSLPFPAEARR